MKRTNLVKLHTHNQIDRSRKQTVKAKKKEKRKVDCLQCLITVRINIDLFCWKINTRVHTACTHINHPRIHTAESAVTKHGKFKLKVQRLKVNGNKSCTWWTQNVNAKIHILKAAENTLCCIFWSLINPTLLHIPYFSPFEVKDSSLLQSLLSH